MRYHVFGALIMADYKLRVFKVISLILLRLSLHYEVLVLLDRDHMVGWRDVLHISMRWRCHNCERGPQSLTERAFGRTRRSQLSWTVVKAKSSHVRILERGAPTVMGMIFEGDSLL